MQVIERYKSSLEMEGEGEVIFFFRQRRRDGRRERACRLKRTMRDEEGR
jgi:hypothetical protein